MPLNISDNPFYTKRFAFFVGRRCREMSLQEVARELRLDWHTVKALDQQYMEEQLRRAPQARPRVMGIDEISVRQGHQYRIVVSDLEKRRAIWFGGKDRSEASLDEFFRWLGPQRRQAVSLAVMDMWRAFAQSTLKEGQAPAQAHPLTTSFMCLRHLGEAIDKVRKQRVRPAGGPGSTLTSKARSTRFCRTGRT